MTDYETTTAQTEITNLTANDGYRYASDGSLVANTPSVGISSAVEIPVSGGEKIRWVCYYANRNSTYCVRYLLADNSVVADTNYTTTGEEYIFTVPQNCVKLLVTCWVINGNNHFYLLEENHGVIGFYDPTGTQNYSVKKIMIQLGSTASAWEAASGIVMNEAGISMNSGKLEFSADSEINFESGGTFNVFATEDDSVIKFGGTKENPNFSLGAGGTVKATKVVTDELEVVGNNGVPMFALTGSLANQMIVSATQPSGHGILWVQPNGSSGTVDFTASTGGTDMSNWNASQSFTFTPQGSALSGSTCTYGIKFSIYNYSGSCYIDQVVVTIAKASAPGTTYTIYSHTYDRVTDIKFIRAGDTFEVNTLNSPSGALTDITDGNIIVTISITKSADTGAQFSAGQSSVLRCNGNGSATVQTCSLFYIP